MKILFVLLSFVLVSSFAFAGTKKANRKYHARSRTKATYAASASVYSMSDIVRHIALNAEKISIINSEDKTFTLSDRSLRMALNEHRENNDKVRFDKFSCKATEQKGILSCRLMVVETLKKGEMGLTGYFFRVSRGEKDTIQLLAPMDPSLVEGGNIPESSAVARIFYSDRQTDAAVFAEFRN